MSILRFLVFKITQTDDHFTELHLQASRSWSLHLKVLVGAPQFFGGEGDLVIRMFLILLNLLTTWSLSANGQNNTIEKLLSAEHWSRLCNPWNHRSPFRSCCLRMSVAWYSHEKVKHIGEALFKYAIKYGTKHLLVVVPLMKRNGCYIQLDCASHNFKGVR